MRQCHNIDMDSWANTIELIYRLSWSSQEVLFYNPFNLAVHMIIHEVVLFSFTLLWSVDSLRLASIEQLKPWTSYLMLLILLRAILSCLLHICKMRLIETAAIVRVVVHGRRSHRCRSVVTMKSRLGLIMIHWWMKLSCLLLSHCLGDIKACGFKCMISSSLRRRHIFWYHRRLVL